VKKIDHTFLTNENVKFDQQMLLKI